MADQNLHDIYEKFDNDVLQMIIHAKAANISLEVDCLYPESFIVGILTTGANSVNSILTRHKVDLEKCLKIFKKKLSDKKKKQGEEIVGYANMKKSKVLVEVCFASEKYSKSITGGDSISLQHIFLATLQVCAEIRKIFEELGLNVPEFIEEVKKNERIEKSPKKKLKEVTEPNDKQNSSLENICINMTELARNNKYDPIIARDEEIENAITILCRRNKSNPILVGEAGTGKTALVEGICQRIVSGTVPKKLRNYKIFGLNMGALVAGTKYRGDFEIRVQNLLKTIIDDANSILFIDEIHTIIGAGSASGSIDVANMLKPALARDLKCIGATTNAEYKKYFVGEGALERRFEKIDIDEPSNEQTKKILLGIRPRLEAFHKCSISDEAIDTAILLSGRYLTSRHFPDKAIDCIDTACAKYSWNDDTDTHIVTSDNIASVVSKQCQVPIEIITLDNHERIKSVEKYLKERVMGQDHVIKSICRTLKNAYSGIRNPNKPIGIFVFGGQSGTGKTYMSKEITKALFNKESSFIRIDMTEFSEPHSVSKITGSPPGYVGFNQVDVISDKIKRRPYCVLLLDEIEKAHPDVIKLFLQIMSDGYFTDSVGNKINCKNIILIMTGNFGMNESGKSGLGFGITKDSTEIEMEKSRLIEFCKTHYGVEFINRVDEFIPFIPLNEEALLKIISLRLNELTGRVSTTIEFSDTVANKILENSKLEHGLNATIIDRLISKEIEPCVADNLLEISNDKNNKYSIKVIEKDGKFISEIIKIKGKKPSKKEKIDKSLLKRETDLTEDES